jgi:hypothetical protein
MKKEFVPYELAVKLKELGFDEPCLACYIDEEDKDILSFSFDSNDCYQEIEDNELKRNTQFKNSITAPTFSQAFKWFREKYDLHLLPSKNVNKWWATFGSWTSEVYDSYEEAELACLDKLIEIVESKQNK